MRCFSLIVGGLLGLGFAHAQDSPDQATGEPMARPDVSGCIEDRAAFLALDFWTFDQDPEKGVRSIAAKEGCELAAADLIRDYHQALRENGAPVIIDHPQGRFTMSQTGEIPLLYWHEGQIRTMEGQTVQAIELFRKTLRSEDLNSRAWNEYALGTIAFLENDLSELERQRALMAESERPNEINLGVLDGLIACFGKSYKTAYGSTECNRRPGSDAAREKN